MKNDSIKKRYLFTVLSNTVKLLTGVVTASIVPRALGPAVYGNFQFLITSMTSIRGIVSVGSDAAFFTANSKVTKSDIIVAVYTLWLLIQLSVVCMMVGFGFSLGYAKTIWPGQVPYQIWVIVGLEFLGFVAQSQVAFGDSKGDTVRVQIFFAFFQVLRMLIISVYFLTDSLTFNSFVGIGYVVSILMNCYFVLYYIKKRNLFFSGFRYDRKRIREIIDYFFQYCHPLAVATIVAILAQFFDRWLLQHLYGSVEQGYYSIGIVYADVLLIFTTSLLPIFWRESAHLNSEGNITKLMEYYRKSFMVLFSLASFCSFFFILNAENFVMLLAGEKFRGAVITLAILGILPIYRSINQIGTTFFYATEKTKLYRNIIICSQLIGIGATYFLIAPRHLALPGLELGSVGLALKLVGTLIIVGNVTTYFVSRILGIGYWYFLRAQVTILLMLGVLGLVCFYLSDLVIQNLGLSGYLMSMSAHGIIYMSLSMLLFLGKPECFGIQRSELSTFKAKVVRYFAR